MKAPLKVGDRVVLRRWPGTTKARTGTVVSIRPRRGFEYLTGRDIIVQRAGLRSHERWDTYFWRKERKSKRAKRRG